MTMKRLTTIIVTTALVPGLAGQAWASAQIKPPSQTPSATAAQGHPDPIAAQTPPKPAEPAKAAKSGVTLPPAPRGVPPPPGYVIGPDDLLQVLFRYDKDLTTDVTVRPDGMISLPMLSDVMAAGLTPEQLRDKVTESAKRFVEDPAVTVIVRTINSRRVFIVGEVVRSGPYPLTAPTTVLQLIAIAGGLNEFAKSQEITVLRVENGRPVSYPFKYKDVIKRKNLTQNIELKPGDTVIVP
jgi:polysaccharide biosynthesis/export protein